MELLGQRIWVQNRSSLFFEQLSLLGGWEGVCACGFGVWLCPDLCSHLDRVVEWWSWRGPEISSRLAACLRPTEENRSKFSLNSQQAAEQLFSADLSITPSTGETSSRSLSINCQSTAFIVRTLFTASNPRKTRLWASQLSQARAQGRREEGKHCVLLEVVPSACAWHHKKATRRGELPVSALSFSPVPREIMAELSSFSLKRLGFSKSNLFPGSHNRTNTWNGTEMRTQVGCVKGEWGEGGDEADMDFYPSSTTEQWWVGVQVCRTSWWARLVGCCANH